MANELSATELKEYYELMKYLNIVFELESKRCVLDVAYEEINSHIEDLAIPMVIKKPILKQEEVPSIVGGFLVAGGVILIACIIGIFFHALLGWLIDSVFVVFLLVGVIMALVTFVSYSNRKNEAELRNRKYLEEYEEEIAKYKADLHADKKRVEQEKREIELYCEQLDYIAEAYNNTAEILEKLYDKSIVYEKYQFDLVAIGMFCEYLESERCYRLTGHEGAYNLYEYEVRFGIIMSQLDEIIEKLDEIQQNQYKIYDALQHIESQQCELISSIHSVAQNQREIINNQQENIEHIKAIEYNTEVLKRNSDIVMMYNLY